MPDAPHMLTQGINVRAPIVPGIGAGGVHLGMSAEALVRLLAGAFSAEALVNSCIQAPTGITRFHSADLDVWTDGGVVTQIGVHGGYRGTLSRMACALGVGATLAQAEAALGPLRWSTAQRFAALSLPGVEFELARLPARARADRATVSRTTPAEPCIAYIYIFPPDET